MLGKGRLRFADRRAPQVFVLVTYNKEKGRKTVEVYIHEKYGKMYDFFEQREFYHSPDCNAYVEGLGKGTLIIEVEAHNG